MPDQRSRPRYVTRDLVTALVISIVLGMAVWLFARGEIEVERSSVDAYLLVSAESPNVVHPPRSHVTLTLRGPKGIVESLEDVRGDYRIPPRDTETRFKLPLDSKYFTLPPDVRIISFNPSEIELDVSHIVSRTLPVRLRLSGQSEVEPGFFVDETASHVSPAEVLVRGPRSILENPDVSSIPTEPISVAFRSASFTTSSEITLDPEAVGPGVSTSERVIALIVIKPQEDSRSFEDCPVMVMLPPNAPFLPLISNPVVTVKVSGPPKVLSKLKRDEILVFARIDAKLKPPFTVSCRVEVPPGRNLSLLGAPPRITVDEIMEIEVPTPEEP